MRQLILTLFAFAILLTAKAQEKETIHLSCPLNEAVVVPPSRNVIHYDEPDFCIVLMSNPDTTVKACINGRVTNIEQTDDSKWDVVFYFKDYYFWYSGLSKIIVKKNEALKSGQPVGYILPGEKMEMLMFKFETPLNPVDYMKCTKLLTN